MSLGNLNFDNITEDDLNEIIEVGIPEGLVIEYKRDIYGKSDENKKEALKDISSFANSFGGHLIIGIDEQNSIPTKISPIKDIDQDIVIQRLENLIRDAIEPRITGVKIRAISIKNGGFITIIRIPKSWNPPHRVRYKNTNRFYVRNSSGAHEASVEELRMLFNRSSTIHERIRAFRKERLGILSVDEGPMRIEHGGRLILHIVPFSAFGYAQSLDVKNIYSNHKYFQPIASMAMTPRYNFDGFINFRGGDKCYGYTQIFRNGIIEATKASFVSDKPGHKVISGLKLGNNIFEVLPGYLEGLRILDVPPPIVVMLSLQEVYGTYLHIGTPYYDEDSYIINSSELLLPEITLEDYGSSQDYQKAMRPTFDALWNAAGYAFSGYFNEDDIWVGEFG
jgi:Putative DNA-binding domain